MTYYSLVMNNSFSETVTLLSKWAVFENINVKAMQQEVFTFMTNLSVLLNKYSTVLSRFDIFKSIQAFIQHKSNLMQ